LKILVFIFCILLASACFSQDAQAIETDLSCETCHGDAGWKIDVGRGFDHIVTGFELKGIHKEISCGHCHPGSTPKEQHNFSSVSSECNYCHEDVHGDQWGQDCSQCHNFDSWTLSTRDQNHDLTRFPLQGAHRNSSCELCHVNQPGSSSTLPVDCAGCHGQDYNESVNPAHLTLNLSNDCEDCHQAVSNSWAESSFNHTSTGYALLGMHAQANCGTCHTQAASNTPTSCEGCHMGDFNVSLDPPHQEQGYPIVCSECHDSFTWNSNFTHDGTGFVLNGAHVYPNCFECHPDQKFSDIPDECSDCHSPEWDTSEIPPHEDAEFDKECETCHTEILWIPSTWDHDVDSEYPLTGAHIEATCDVCHISTPYSEQASECYTCHQADYEATLEPNHVAGNIPTACEVCHTTLNWESEEIDHSQTQFPLVGAHAELGCMTCHEAGYDLAFLCESCHSSDYANTSTGAAPNHGTFEFSMDCLICHNQTSWSPSHFDHDPDLTGYEIQGAHLELLPDNCFVCHESAVWTGISKLCQDCHQNNFMETTDPNHQASGIPDNLCELCHTQSAWTPSIFSHNTTTESCVTCHLVQYNSASIPPHSDAEFNTQCQTCHSADIWVPALWNHGVETDFTIIGAHEPLSCPACHTSAPYSTLINECSICHQSNFDSTTDPDHAGNGFPINLCESCHDQSVWNPSIFSHASASVVCVTCHTAQYDAAVNPSHPDAEFDNTCENCHTTDTWSPGIWEHGTETEFEIQGAHEVLNCVDCHTSAPYSSLINECSTCHQSNFDQTTAPRHVDEGYPILLCESCHSQTAWQPCIFNHESTEDACSTCHMSQYTATDDPPHVSLSYPTDCTACHTTDAWSPSTFIHDLETQGFLLDGAHEALNCSSCHEDWEPPTEIRTCASASCHLDNYQASENPPHETMSFSQGCVDCHTTSSWVPAQFTHSLESTGFALEEAHTIVSCQQCHSPWQIIPEPRTCSDASCHLSDYQNATDPNHGAASFPLNCESCHSMTAWVPSTFNHDGQYFPIYSGQHNGEWSDCSQCHINSADFSEFTCFGGGCHNAADMNDEHFDDGQWVSCNGHTYPASGVTSVDCFTCHPTGDGDDCDGFFDFLKNRPKSYPTKKNSFETK